MSTVDKAKLRELAEKQAWTGRWYDAGCETVSCDYNGEHGDHMHGEVAHPEPTGAAGFIAAANPSTILALLDEIEALRTCLAETAGVAVTMLYESHKADTLKEFNVEELTQMVDSTKHLSDANAQVEKIYRKAWDMAQGVTDHG